MNTKDTAHPRTLRACKPKGRASSIAAASPRSLSWLKRKLALRQGQRAEALAAGWLARQGYTLCARNVRLAGAELDLIGWEGPVLCFIEVRSTSSSAWGGAAASVTWTKQRRIIRAAQAYLQRLPELPAQSRFDVVTIDWASSPPALELLRGAFDAS